MEVCTTEARETHGKKKKKNRRRRKESNGEGKGEACHSTVEAVKGPKKKRKRRQKSRDSNYLHPQSSSCPEALQCTQDQQEGGVQTEPTKAALSLQSSSKHGGFLDKMRARLLGGQFRMLNEKLYTCRGVEALDLFKNDSTLFNMYHAGYQEQMSHWPQQPVDVITEWLRDHSPSLVVADFGCGDARLAKNVRNNVFSIDLVSCDPSVIACDMAHTPLITSSVDVAVFCLSLMGTDFPDYLKEAHRVLKPRGWLLIAEVKSRFDPGTGGADPRKFMRALQSLGFSVVSKDFSNKMFVLFYLRKEVIILDSYASWKEWPSARWIPLAMQCAQCHGYGLFDTCISLHTMYNRANALLMN